MGRRRGAAAIEFAAVAPVLTLLVLGMIEVGRGVNVQHTLLNAARAGCRAGIVEGATEQEISSRVADNLVGAGINVHTVTVNPSPITSAVSGDPVTVTVSANYTDVNWVPTTTISKRHGNKRNMFNAARVSSHYYLSLDCIDLSNLVF